VQCKRILLKFHAKSAIKR